MQNKNARDIRVTYTNSDNVNIAVILEAIYEAAGLLYAAKPSTDTAVA